MWGNMLKRWNILWRWRNLSRHDQCLEKYFITAINIFSLRIIYLIKQREKLWEWHRTQERCWGAVCCTSWKCSNTRWRLSQTFVSHSQTQDTTAHGSDRTSDMDTNKRLILIMLILRLMEEQSKCQSTQGAWRGQWWSSRWPRSAGWVRWRYTRCWWWTRWSRSSSRNILIKIFCQQLFSDFSRRDKFFIIRSWYCALINFLLTNCWPAGKFILSIKYFEENEKYFGQTYRSQHDSSGIFEGQSGGEAIDSVLVDTIGHVDDDHAGQAEVEECLGPVRGVHHGQDDGHDEDQDLHQHCPHNPGSQIVAGEKNLF